MDALTKQHHTAESSRIEEKHKAIKIAVEILQTLRQKLQCLSTFIYVPLDVFVINSASNIHFEI
jgi:hypothetical protein